MSELTKSDGGVLFYDVQGPADGAPIVLIEGLSAHLLGWRDEFCQILVVAGHRVVRLDNRDVGLSQKYPDQPYGLVDLADDVHELIGHLEIAPAHVVGQSMGGMVAQHLVIRHPKDVASLALLYTAATPSHILGDARSVEVLQTIPRARTREQAIEFHIEQERVCASRDFSFDEEWKRELGGLMWDRGYDPDGVVRQRDALLDNLPDLAELARVSVPTTLIHGTTDRLLAASGSVELHETIPDSQLWLVEGMGHDLPRELWPDVTDRIIANAERAASRERQEA